MEMAQGEEDEAIKGREEYDLIPKSEVGLESSKREKCKKFEHVWPCSLCQHRRSP